MPEALIAATARTPIGRAHKGSLATERPDDLLAFALAETLARVPELDPARIEDVIVGCGYPEQKQGRNVARRAALLAGIPVSVPGVTVSRFCASSLQAVRLAFHAIAAGEGDAFLVGGVESVSSVDMTPRSEDEPHPRLTGGEGAICDAYIPMGMTAENVAERYDVAREEMDRFAQRSQELAVAAVEQGLFAREIVPYTTAAGATVAADDGPRPSSTYEKLAALDPVFKEGGRVTAGNACPLNDGAAAALVVSDRLAAELGIETRARVVATAAAALEPEYMGVGPIEAVRTALRRAGLTIDDIDVFELNEAFAAQVLPVCEAVGIDPFGDRFNPLGGAIALGHPFGMTGARILGTLLTALEQRDGRYGLETMCVAGGQGMAMVVERTV
ncbi:MAG: acetyl-CoA C-acyltransferase [Solirubrobacterales bacterium]|nr:acetyl-CoA C-acyltransferase [Solirubrobacterales bacterium]